MWPPPGDYSIPSKKNFQKVDPVCKLQVISALDSGQSKVELAKQYGLHPTILTYIYRQKEFLTKTYKEKLVSSVQNVRSMNLDMLLIDWLKTEIKESNLISEDDLNEKVEEFLGPAVEEFANVQEWIREFRSRHSVINYSLNVIDDGFSKEEWTRLLTSYSEDNVYVGATCGLWHSLDVSGFLSDTTPESYVSILMVTNASGSDKRPLLVVGIETIAADYVQSHPLKYYKQYTSSLITVSTLKKYLEEWDSQLQKTKQTVALVLDIPPEFYQHMKLCNIILIQFKSMNWLRKAIDKITNCFKYNYRRTQITKMCLRNIPEHSLSECSHTISYAWHCLTVKFIRHLLYPPCQMSLLKICNDNDVKIKELSLSEWSQATSLPLGLEEVHSKLDGLITCDQHLKSISMEAESQESEDMVTDDDEVEPVSVADAFQAMRRLTMYLQGESAKDNIIQSAKALENHVEYNLLLEVQRNVPKSENTEKSTNKN